MCSAHTIVQAFYILVSALWIRGLSAVVGIVCQYAAVYNYALADAGTSLWWLTTIIHWLLCVLPLIYCTNTLIRTVTIAGCVVFFTDYPVYCNNFLTECQIIPLTWAVKLWQRILMSYKLLQFHSQRTLWYFP